MHLMHFTPALLLASALPSAASVLHTELRPEPAANANVTAYDAILEANPSVLARNGPGRKVFLTKDNTCGKTGAGKEHGWYCDSKLARGGACCSSDGWCGNGPKYCEVGCQEAFGHCDKGIDKTPKAAIKCGPKNKNTKCGKDECCSSNGFCGNNKNFCGIGCQDKFGKCGKPKPLPAKPVKPLEPRCGPTNKNQKCPNNQCCSPAGFCGIGIEYCAVPQNCLRGFGRCDSDIMPPGVSTLKDPRPQLGKIKYGEYIMDCKLPGTVALTFDDGPNVYTSELLDKLKVAGAKATFLVAGNTNGRGELDKGSVWPKILKRMLAEGHQIGSHTWSHPHMNAIKSEDRRMDMAKNERAIANVIGKYPTYMRPPYGECDAKSGCLKDLHDMGYTPLVGFDTQDWMNAAGHIQKSEKLVKEFFKNLGPAGHALFCQHDTLAASVQELTTLILEEIKHKGFRAVTVGECLGDDKKNWYRMPGKGTSAPMVAKAEDVSDVPIVVAPPSMPQVSEPLHDTGKPDDSPVIVIPSPGKPQASASSSRSGVAIEDIETDHQMENNEMKITRTDPKLPTFPSAEDVRARDDDEALQSSESEVDDNAKSFMSLDDIAADEAARTSPEDVVEAAEFEAAWGNRCLYRRGRFCGRIRSFHTKHGCFASSEACHDDVFYKCAKASEAEHLDDKDNGRDGCAKWDQICNQQVLFCKNCTTGNGAPPCKSSHFKPSNPKNLIGN